MTGAFVTVAVAGLAVGWFLNLVISRVPQGRSPVRPGSRCPHCAAPIKPWHNVPVLGWLMLRGRCYDCSEPISARYPLVEAITGVLLAAVVAVHHAHTAQLVLGLVLVAVLVPLALIDLDTGLLPNRITYPAAVVGVALGVALDPSGEPGRLLAALAAGGVFVLISLLHPRGMGMGDAKLVAVMGLFLGAPVAVAVFGGLISGSVIGVLIVARKGVNAGRRTTVPFGPFLALGGVIAVLVGAPLVHAYAAHL
jgi:leader peptidase (prepilin peptidase)/N-methyltransferase